MIIELLLYISVYITIIICGIIYAAIVIVVNIIIINDDQDLGCGLRI